MNNYTTLTQHIYTAKRSIVHFSSKLGKGMQKPNKDFLMDIFFGLAKEKSVILSDISKAVKEPIDTIQTVKQTSFIRLTVGTGSF